MNSVLTGSLSKQPAIYYIIHQWVYRYILICHPCSTNVRILCIFVVVTFGNQFILIHSKFKSIICQNGRRRGSCFLTINSVCLVILTSADCLRHTADVYATVFRYYYKAVWRVKITEILKEELLLNNKQCFVIMTCRRHNNDTSFTMHN